MNNDLDTLRPEIREAVAAIDKGNGVFVNGDDCEGGIAWATARAELLRLARENDEWQTRCLQFQTERDKARAGLAALKARIAKSALVLCEVPEHAPEDDPDYGFFYMPRSLWNTRVALVKVED